LRNGQDGVLTSCHFLDMTSAYWVYVVGETRLIQRTHYFAELPRTRCALKAWQKVRTYHPQYKSSPPKVQSPSFQSPSSHTGTSICRRKVYAYDFKHVSSTAAFKTCVWNVFGEALYSCKYRGDTSRVAATYCTGNDEEN
jgi:hypothetical protein